MKTVLELVAFIAVVAALVLLPAVYLDSDTESIAILTEGTDVWR